MTTSAGEHDWREVCVHIFPTVTGARYAVIIKRKKGTRTEWARTLCVREVVEADLASLESVAGVLKGAAASLAQASDLAASQAPKPRSERTPA